MKQPGSIALFGGTFDPIHNGHIALAEQARQLAQVERVLFIPCRQSPHKNDPPVASVEQRCDMIELALAPLDWAELSQVETERSSPSFSWQTAEHFTGRFPCAKLFWILGTDQWSKIETWAEPETLRRLLRFIVAMRDGDVIKTRPGWNHLPLIFDHPASSTAIRSGDYDSTWLPEPTLDYIASRQVYS